MRKIILISPRGFCAGVRRAIGTTKKALEIYGAPVYVNHQIVHNDYVVKELEKEGAVFVNNLSEVPDGSVLIFSAHGVSPELRKTAEKKKLKVIDATCLLVAKVHSEAVKYFKEGYSIVIIGHRNHQEIIGTIGEAPMHVIEKKEDVVSLELESPDKAVYLTQTTLSTDDVKDIVEELKRKYPSIIAPPGGDICYATQNRQGAVKEAAASLDTLLVVGSKNSSNSNRLVEVARNKGVNAFLVNNADEVNTAWLEKAEKIGVTAGASAPEDLVMEVVECVKNIFKSEGVSVENHAGVLENTIFPLPKEVEVND